MNTKKEDETYERCEVCGTEYEWNDSELNSCMRCGKNACRNCRMETSDDGAVCNECLDDELF